uniref:Uncharacterized protein n=1 Tax=Anopheles atroparvus TaxID=41427 RepID=A0AAG5CUB5_ANOAO
MNRSFSIAAQDAWCTARGLQPQQQERLLLGRVRRCYAHGSRERLRCRRLVYDQ